MEHWLHVDRRIPQGRELDCDAEIFSGDPERSGGEGGGVDGGALVMQLLPVDRVMVFSCPESDVAELAQSDAAVYKMLVGVQNQVQEMLVRRHGEKTVDLDRLEVREKAIQIVVRVIGGIEQMPVQLNVQGAVLFCVGHLIRGRQLVRCGFRGQASREKLLMARQKSPLRDVYVVVGTDAVILQRIQPAAQRALDHDRIESRGTELTIKVGKFHGTHGLAEHLSDDLLFHNGKQRRVLTGGGRFAHSFKKDRQELLLPGESEHGLPIHAVGRQISTGDGGFCDLQELCFVGGEGHAFADPPFFMDFDGMGEKERGGADKRAQRVADHVVRLGKAQSIMVLGVLDGDAEQACGERGERDSAPAMPPMG